MSLSLAQPKWTKEKQDLMIDHIKDKVNTAIPGFTFIKTPTYFPGPEKFAAYIKETYNKTFLVKYAMLWYNSFVDSKNKGYDITPSTFPSFTLQLFHEYKEARLNDDETAWLPNSHDILVDALIELRNECLRNREVIENKIIQSPLEQMSPLVLAGECPFVKELKGDWINFKIGVEIV